MSLPNAITIFRIIIAPIICVLISYELSIYACVCFIAACTSDFFDGYTARLYKLSSKFGQHFDSFADKFLITSISIALVQNQIVRGVNVVPIYVIVSRNLAMYFIRNYVNEVKHKNIIVNSFGKFTTFAQMVSISLLIVGFAQIGNYILWFSMISSLYSFGIYFYSI
ncbi:CDP-alcohol phosphatidyltransferase family protein [Candidatus Cytomitobacter primus]|nr:CDP-alcohol phosphatidyltransferase family protein [Candidatus Cytomitobacter primus]